MNQNIIRQIVDIQAQAERLVRTQADTNQIEQFSRYNDEIKSFLLSNIDDDFVLKYVKEIPDLNLDETDYKSGVFDLLLGVFGGWFALYYQKRKAQKHLETVRDIRGVCFCGIYAQELFWRLIKIFLYL